jgi:prophage antirepressor-like protein
MLNINEYFNGFQIRIIGTSDLPMFYASDFGEALGIEKIRNTLSTFGPDDLVSKELRERHNIITYRSNGKKDSRIHLLTLQGVIRLINISRKDYANDFRKFITELVNNIRLQQQEETGIELKLGEIVDRSTDNTPHASLLLDSETKFNHNLSIRTKLKPLYIFEKTCDPTRNQQILDLDVSSDEDEDIHDSDNILYIMKKVKQLPYDDYYKERVDENTIDEETINRKCYLIVTDNHFSSLYLKYNLETTLYTTNPEASIKYLRKEWSSFVGSSQRLKDKLLLTMEKDFFIEDLKRHIS